MERKRSILARGFLFVRNVAPVAVAIVSLASIAIAAGPSDDDLSTSVVPAAGGAAASAGAKGGTAGAAPSAAEEGTTPAPGAKSKPKALAHSSANSVSAPEIEPAKARLKLLSDAWVYSAPAKSSKKLEQVHKDKFVIVTGSTHYYLQIKLKSGETGYLDPSAVDMVKPADNMFHLTHDAAVLDKPNRWAKKLSEVHTGHDVHVVGASLDYVKIRMKSGLEGFIPMTALE